MSNLPKLKPKVKKLWIKALRSGDFKQGQGCLRSHDNKYCCLGVLCEMHRKATKKKGWDKSGRYNGESSFLPEKVAKWAFEDHNKVDDGDGDYIPLLGKENNAINANDNLGLSFKKIAKLIDKNL